jgi:tetratricopeptide (TPR) repeat protein
MTQLDDGLEEAPSAPEPNEAPEVAPDSAASRTGRLARRRAREQAAAEAADAPADADATDDAPDEPPLDADAIASARLDRRVNVALGVIGLALVVFAAYFAYGVYAQQQAAKLSSPALVVIDALTTQVDANPNDATLRSRLAEALGAAGRYDDAKAQLLIAVQIDKKYVGAYQNLATIELLQKDFANAEVHLKKVLELTNTGQYANLNERREFANFHLGEIALMGKRYEDAVGYFNAAIRIRKDASDTYLRLAQAYVGLDYKDKAKEQIEIALAFDPRYPEAHFEQGKILLSEGDKVNAAWEFRVALDGAPEADEPRKALESLGTYDSWYEKAVAAFAAGKLSEALDAARISRAIQPSSYDAAMLNGRILEKQGDFSGAADAYSTAMKSRAGDTVAADAFARSEEASRTKGAK